MQAIRFLTFISFLFLALACEKDDKTSIPSIDARLSEDEITSKTGREISTTFIVKPEGQVGTLTITKTINTFVDQIWENNGVYTATLTPGEDNTYQYTFVYEVLDRDADKLIGFTFTYTNDKGETIQRDLTLNAILSAEQTLYTRRWKLIGKMWTSKSPPVNDLSDCESDDVWLFHADGTFNIEYGSKACLFDGFNSFPAWNLSEDETTLSATFRNVFNGVDDVQVYKIKTINRDRLIWEYLVDLTVFGEGPEEVFLYTFEAVN